MTQSIKQKILFNFNISLVVIMTLSVISVGVLFFIQSQVQINRKVVLPLTMVSKDLNYLIESHWSTCLLTQTMAEPKTHDYKLRQLENRINKALSDFYQISSISELYTLRNIDLFLLRYQLIKADNHYRDYSFLANRLINLKLLENEVLEKDFIALNTSYHAAQVEIELLNENIQAFQEGQMLFLKQLMTFLLIIFIVISTLFVTFYTYFWKRTVKQVTHSFEKGLQYISSHLDKNLVTINDLKNVDAEVKQFIALVMNVLQQLRLSEKKLESASHRLTTIRQEERAEIAQHLHDNLGQNITALQLENKVLTTQLPDLNSNSKRTFERIKYIQDDSMKIIRQITSNLKIPEIKEIGLLNAIKKLIDYRNELQFTQFELHLDEPDALSNLDHELVVYQCVQESITNILKHANASNADIVIQDVDKMIVIDVIDDGQGMSKEFSNPHSMGLEGMKAAINRINGDFVVHSKKNQGTQLTFIIPKTRQTI